MINIVFRLDDPSPISDHAAESTIIEIFRRCGFPLSVAVVPFRIKDGKLFAITRDNATHLWEAFSRDEIDILLHGHSHISRSNGLNGNQTEFAGLDPEEQRRLIIEGSDQLFEFTGRAVNCFVPPWNSYDWNTLRVLDDLGFSTISAGTNPMIRSASLVTIAATCNLKSVRRALKEAIKYTRCSPVVVVNFHPDDFIEHSYTRGVDDPQPFTNFVELTELLNELKSDQRFYVSSMSEMSANQNAASKFLLAKELQILRYCPWTIKSKIPKFLLFQRKRDLLRCCFHSAFVGA